MFQRDIWHNWNVRRKSIFIQEISLQSLAGFDINLYNRKVPFHYGWRAFEVSKWQWLFHHPKQDGCFMQHDWNKTEWSYTIKYRTQMLLLLLFFCYYLGAKSRSWQRCNYHTQWDLILPISCQKKGETASWWSPATHLTEQRNMTTQVVCVFLCLTHAYPIASEVI